MNEFEKKQTELAGRLLIAMSQNDDEGFVSVMMEMADNIDAAPKDLLDADPRMFLKEFTPVLYDHLKENKSKRPLHTLLGGLTSAFLAELKNLEESA